MNSPSVDTGTRDGLVAVVKNDCPTCQLLVPTLEDLGKAGKLTVITQDEMDLPYEEEWVVNDEELEISWNLELDTVPTLLNFDQGTEISRTVGWSRDEWREMFGDSDLGEDLPEFKPG
tara:strand:+ start:1350 stop:1703 length:354 start_codon:yes stop_codon:yes gene_type:complete